VTIVTFLPKHSVIRREDYNSSTGSFNPFYLWDDSTTLVREQMKDERPLTRRRKPKGWLPPTPYYRKTWMGDVWHANVSAKTLRWNGSGADETTCTGALDTSSYLPPLASPPVGFQAKCEAGALRKLKAQNVNYSVALGERRQTGQLCFDSLKRLADLVREVRSGNPAGLIRAAGRRVRRKRVRSLDPAFDLWLEYKYGWLPLLSDVHGAVKDLNEREKEPYRTRVTVKSGNMASEEQVIRCRDSMGGDYIDWDMIIRTKHKCMVRLDYVRNDSPWASLSHYGITNPLSVAWELVPWSFVADWFVPIGAYLDLLDADLGWDLLGGSASIKTESKYSYANPTCVTTSWAFAQAQASVSGSGRQSQFTRTTYSSSPIPSLSYLTTKFSSGSPQHVQNGIALFMSALTHRYR